MWRLSQRGRCLSPSEYRRRSRFGCADRKEQGRFDSLHFGQIKFPSPGGGCGRDVQKGSSGSKA